MPKRGLLILLLLAVGLSGAAFWLSQGSSQPVDSVRGPLFPGLANELAAVTQIEIKDGGKRELKFTLADDRWVVPALANAPVKTEEVRTLLLGLIRAERVERKTSKSDRFDALGLDPATAKSLVLKAADGEVVSSVLIGSVARGGENRRYVKREDEANAFTVDNVSPVTADPSSWVDLSLPNISSTRLKSIETELADLGPVRLEKRLAGDIVLHINETETPAPPSARERFDAYGFWQFSSVQPREDVDFSGAQKITLTTYDGLVLVLDLAAVPFTPEDERPGEERHWVRMKIAEAEIADDAVMPDAPADLAAERAKLAELERFAFEISAFQANRMTLTAEDVTVANETTPVDETEEETIEP
ncbi:MAG: DUF4340 domain-containing protein [Pseudomonadota bacterium]